MILSFFEEISTEKFKKLCKIFFKSLNFEVKTNFSELNPQKAFSWNLTNLSLLNSSLKFPTLEKASKAFFQKLKFLKLNKKAFDKNMKFNSFDREF